MSKSAPSPFVIAKDHVEVVRPFAKAPAIAYTLAFLGLGPLQYFNPDRGISSFADLPAWDWALLAGGFLAWLYFLAGVKTTTRFDFVSRTVARRNLFGLTQSIAFDDVASIILVEASDPLGKQGYFYQLARKDNLYGKGLRLTARYPSDAPHLQALHERALPYLNFRIFGDACGPPPLQEEIEAIDGFPPANPTYYKRTGMVYCHNRLLRVSIVLVLGFGLFIGGAAMANTNGNLFFILCLAGFICPFYTLCFHWRIAFDLDNDTCIVTMPFFVWRNRLPINRYLTLIASRTTIRGTYLGTWLYLEGIDRKGRLRKYALDMALIRTPALSRAALETQQILDSTLNRALIKQNKRENTDLLPRVRRPYLQMTHHDEYA